MPGDNSGQRQPGNSAVPSTVGRLGVDGFWVGDYGGGGPGRPPCWRTLKESCKGLGSVSLKINNQHTQESCKGLGSVFLKINNQHTLSKLKFFRVTLNACIVGSKVHVHCRSSEGNLGDDRDLHRSVAPALCAGARSTVSTVAHLADSASGPSGCPRDREFHDSKVQSVPL